MIFSYLNADSDPDPGSQTNADPDPDPKPGQTEKSQKVEFLHDKNTQKHIFEVTKAILKGRKLSLFVNFDQFPFSWIRISIPNNTDPDSAQPNPQH